MRRRAERHGGTFVLTTPAADGTRPWFPQSVNPTTIPWQARVRPQGHRRGRASCGHSLRGYAAEV